MRASAFWLARSVQASWGEPARPGLTPEGETGKGVFKDSLLPQANSADRSHLAITSASGAAWLTG